MRLYWTLLTCTFLALSVACGGGSGDSRGSSGSQDSTPPRANGTSADSVTGQDATGTDAASADSKIVITSFVDLEVESVRGAFDDVGRLARSVGGFVADARLSEGDKAGAATIRLRIPASRYDETMTSLRAINGANVKREELRSNEVTAAYTDLQSRLRNFESTEAQYRTLLARAVSINEILEINGRIDAVRGEIERTRGRINLFDDQSAYATFNVTLSAIPAAATTSPAGAPSPVEVLHDTLAFSIDVAHVIANALVVLAVAGLWILPAGIGLLIVRRRYGRRLVSLWSRLLSW